MAYLEGLNFTQIAGPAPLRRVLPNGLEVLYTHRPGIGLCTVQGWVRTGSAQEGKWEGSGISHYLEHMVFKATARFANRELTEAIHRVGGSSNAYTTFDRTVYYVDAPEEGFATAMEAISEMVFDPLISEEDAKVERDVILREIAMRDDEHDSIFAEKILEEALHVHPMRHPIIGHKDLFIKITPDDLRAYHKGRYAPENVVLAIGGSMDPDEVFKSVEQWFGRFSRNPVIQEVPVIEPPMAAPRRVEVARDVSICKGVATWKIPGFFAKDRSAIDLFLGVLGSGNSSILWDELRENKKLVHAVDAHAMGLKDIGLAWLSWIGDAHADHTVIEKSILEKINELQDNGVSQAQFEKVRRQTVVAMVNGLKTIHAATARSAYAACMGYDHAWPLRGVEELARLTPEDLTQVGRTYLKPESVTFAVMNAKKSTATSDTKAQIKTPDAFEVITLENGVRVVLQEDHSVPKAGFGVYFSAGIAYENDAKRGATGILSTLLTRDTVQHSRQEVAQIVDRIGATFADVGSQLSCGLWGEALSSDFEQIAELVKNGILTPKILGDAFESEKASAIAACKEAADDIVEKARLRLLKQFFGNHPLSIDACGTPETIEKLKQSDIFELHKKLVVSSNLIIGISGSFDRRVALDFVKKYFGILPKVEFKQETLKPHTLKPSSEDQFTAVGEQAVVCLAFPHCGFAPVMVTAANVIEELLSGMASGLFQRVREEKGLAYFVGATRVETADQGMFYLYGGTTQEAAQQVIDEMKGELARLSKGEFKEHEIEDAKRRLRVGRRQGRQSAGRRMQGALTRELVGLGANFDAEWERRMNETDSKQIQSYAQKYFKLSHAQQLIVVPKKA